MFRGEFGSRVNISLDSYISFLPSVLTRDVNNGTELEH
jgi:hypothetical protein